GRRPRRRLVAARRPPRDGPEQDQAVDQAGMPAGEQATRHRCPRMADDRKTRDAVMRENEAHGCSELLGGIFGPAERRVRRGRLAHFRIAIGAAVTQEIKGPDLETGLAQRVTPRISVEPISDRERRRKSGAVHIKNRSYAFARRYRRRQMSQEKLEP